MRITPFRPYSPSTGMLVTRPLRFGADEPKKPGDNPPPPASELPETGEKSGEPSPPDLSKVDIKLFYSPPKDETPKSEPNKDASTASASAPGSAPKSPSETPYDKLSTKMKILIGVPTSGKSGSYGKLSPLTKALALSKPWTVDAGAFAKFLQKHTATLQDNVHHLLAAPTLEGVTPLIQHIEQASDHLAASRKIIGQHPNEVEMMLLMRHPMFHDVSQKAHKDQLVKSLTSITRFIRHGLFQTPPEVLDNWGHIGALSLGFRHLKYDAMGKENALLAKFGGVYFHGHPITQTFGNGFLFSKKLTPSLPLDEETVVLLLHGLKLVSHPSHGTLIIRNSSKVFGRDLLDHPAYYTPRYLTPTDLKTYDPKTDETLKHILDPTLYTSPQAATDEKEYPSALLFIDEMDSKKSLSPDLMTFSDSGKPSKDYGELLAKLTAGKDNPYAIGADAYKTIYEKLNPIEPTGDKKPSSSTPSTKNNTLKHLLGIITKKAKTEKTSTASDSVPPETEPTKSVTEKAKTDTSKPTLPAYDTKSGLIFDEFFKVPDIESDLLDILKKPVLGSSDSAKSSPAIDKYVFGPSSDVSGLYPPSMLAFNAKLSGLLGQLQDLLNAEGDWKLNLASRDGDGNFDGDLTSPGLAAFVEEMQYTHPSRRPSLMFSNRNFPPYGGFPFLNVDDQEITQLELTDAVLDEISDRLNGSWSDEKYPQSQWVRFLNGGLAYADSVLTIVDAKKTSPQPPKTQGDQSHAS